MTTLADSGAVALEAIVVASIVVPAVILVVVCWIFYRARRLVVAWFPAPASGDVDQDLADRAGFDRGMGVGRLLEGKTVERQPGVFSDRERAL